MTTQTCPSCGAEYRAHVASCADCDAMLEPTRQIDARSLRLPLSDDLAPVSILDDEAARDLLDALAAAAVPHWAGVVEIEGGPTPMVLVRPEDRARAAAVAETVGVGTLDVPLPFSAAEARDAFSEPDLTPGPEEESASTRVTGATVLAVACACAVAAGALDLFDGWLDAALLWGGALGLVLALLSRTRARDDRDRLRRRRLRDASLP